MTFSTDNESREGWKSIQDRHSPDADWFLKTTDDGYIVMEHLKEFVSAYDTDLPLHFGHPHTYLISKESLKRIYSTRQTFCEGDQFIIK